MESTELKDAKTVVCRLDRGSDLLGQMKRLAVLYDIGFGFFTLIGASQSAKLSYFDQVGRAYVTHSVDEPCEIVSCTGNIAFKGGDFFVHAHAMLGKSDGSTVGGHVDSLVVYAGEAHMTSSSGRVERFYDEDTGLYLMRLGKEGKDD